MNFFMDPIEICRQQYFANTTKATGVYWCTLQNDIAAVINRIVAYENQICVFSGIINIFHLVVLTRKSMRGSSINLMMAVVAFADILSFFYQFKLYTTILLGWYSGSCWEFSSYELIYTDNLLSALKKFARRCSVWLCFFIALIRTLVVRNPLDIFYERLSDPITAFIISLVVMLVSFPLSIFTWLGLQIEFYEAPSFCNFSITTKHFYADVSDFFLANDAIAMVISQTLDALVSFIIPSALFPIATLFLVIELWKADENRKRLFSTTKANESRKTTRLVYYFTLTFFVAGFPLGVNTALLQFFLKFQGMLMILNDVNRFFSMLLSANTSTHFVVCIFMSSQYREAAKLVLRCGIQKKVVAPISKVADSSPLS